MQKTFIEKVHSYLDNEDTVVQDFALSLLEKSFQANEDTLPLILEANKNRKKTSIRNLPLVYAREFPITERVFLQLLQQIKNYDKKSEDYRTALVVLMNSPIPLLEQYKEGVEPILNFKQKELFHELIALNQTPTSDLFADLKKYAEKMEYRYDSRSFQMAGKIIEIISSRSDWDRSLVEKVLEREMNEDFFSIYGVFFVMLAGEERLEQLTSCLVELLFRDLDQDVLVEEATNALIKIGTSEVVDRVKSYVSNEETGPFAIDVLKEIKSPHAEDVLLKLIEETEIEPVRTLIADALCRQLSVKAVPIIEKIIEDEYASWYLDLQESLYCNCVINGIDHPKLSKWREEIDDMVLPDDNFNFMPMTTVKTEPIRTEPKIGRNDPCPCGSGKKYKKCCGA